VIHRRHPRLALPPPSRSLAARSHVRARPSTSSPLSLAVRSRSSRRSLARSRSTFYFLVIHRRHPHPRRLAARSPFAPPLAPDLLPPRDPPAAALASPSRHLAARSLLSVPRLSVILPLPRRPCSSLPCRSFLRAAPPLPFSPPPPLPSVTAVPPYRRSYSAAPTVRAVPFVPPSDALPAVCCRRAALPPTLAVPRRLYTHTHTSCFDGG
jgi:hypothetical protein